MKKYVLFLALLTNLCIFNTTFPAKLKKNEFDFPAKFEEIEEKIKYITQQLEAHIDQPFQ